MWVHTTTHRVFIISATTFTMTGNTCQVTGRYATHSIRLLFDSTLLKSSKSQIKVKSNRKQVESNRMRALFIFDTIESNRMTNIEHSWETLNLQSIIEQSVTTLPASRSTFSKKTIPAAFSIVSRGMEILVSRALLSIASFGMASAPIEKGELEPLMARIIL